MSGKWNVATIVTAHYRTLESGQSGRRSRDVVAFVGVPIAVGVVSFGLDRTLVAPTAVLAGIGVFTALLFALLANVLNLSIKLRLDEGLPTDSRLVQDVKELFTNVAYAVLVGLAVVTYLVIMATATGTHLEARISTALFASLFTHLLMTVLMCVKRLWLAHDHIGEAKRLKAGRPARTAA